MPVVIFIALMLALLAFILWDRKQMTRIPTRKEMENGFTPGASTAGACVGLIAFAAVSALFGWDSWVNPPTPPFSGRGSLLKIWAYGALGPRSFPIFSFLFSAVCVFLTLKLLHAHWHRKRRNQ